MNYQLGMAPLSSKDHLSVIDILFSVRLAVVVDGKWPGCFLGFRAECVHPTKTFSWYLRK